MDFRDVAQLVDPDILVGATAQIAGLLNDFHASRSSRKAATWQEFQEWLHEHRHDSLMSEARQTGATVISLKVLLHQHTVFVKDMFERLEARYQANQQPTPELDSAASLSALAALEVSLACHSWKVYLMNIRAAASLSIESDSTGYFDVWDLMRTEWIPAYSPTEYQRYLPLFTNSLDSVRADLDRIQMGFHHVLPHKLQIDMLTLRSNLQGEAMMYALIPSLMYRPGFGELNATGEPIFRARFEGTISSLAQLARLADTFSKIERKSN